MQSVLFAALLCVLASCWLTNISHVAGTLSKKNKKDKKNSEQSRSVRPFFFCLSNPLSIKIFALSLKVASCQKGTEKMR